MSEKTFLFIRQASRNIRLDPQRILYIEARKNYSWLVTTEKSFMVLTPLKDWLQFLPQDSFCRIHRSYIVNVGKIVYFDRKTVHMPPGIELAIGEQFRGALENKVIIVGGEIGNRQLAENCSSPSLTKLQHTA
jgi:hypothetical protein